MCECKNKVLTYGWHHKDWGNTKNLFYNCNVLDKKYLRFCAVYKMVKHRKLTIEQAEKLVTIEQHHYIKDLLNKV